MTPEAQFEDICDELKVQMAPHLYEAVRVFHERLTVASLPELRTLGNVVPEHDPIGFAGTVLTNDDEDISPVWKAVCRKLIELHNAVSTIRTTEPICLECEEPRECHDGDYCYRHTKPLSATGAIPK